MFKLKIKDTIIKSELFNGTLETIFVKTEFLYNFISSIYPISKVSTISFLLYEYTKTEFGSIIYRENIFN